MHGNILLTGQNFIKIMENHINLQAHPYHPDKDKNLFGNLSPQLELPELSNEEIQALDEEMENIKAKRYLEIQKKKKQAILMQPYLQKMALNELVPNSADELLNLVVNKYGPQLAKNEEWESDFIIPSQLKELYWKLSLYFSNDNRMEQYGLSNKRGILIFGNVGCGKTTALRVFENNPLQPFTTHTCQDVVNEYNQLGAKTIDKYGSNSYNEYKSQYYGHSQFGRAFDDLGTEDIGYSFGKSKEVFEEILMKRYSNSATRGPLTHLTTNILPEDILKKYGMRLYDRLGASFNIISLPTNVISLRPQPKFV